MTPQTLQGKSKKSLKTLIENLGTDPGVYMMKGDLGEVLYVGKAKNLKNRVSSYFLEKNDHGARTILLVSKIKEFEVIITDSEAEALILECSLIKKLRPRFNVLLKDDKTYPYVRLDVNHPFPRLEYTRRLKRDGARYFGPFVSAMELTEMLAWTRKQFQLRDCTDSEFQNRSRPCVLYQIGQCSAPCVGKIPGEEYGRSIDAVLKILEGRTEEVLKELKKQMLEASDKEDFERAGHLRDQISHIEKVTERQKVFDPESDLDRDLIQFARAPTGEAVVVLMAVREGRTLGVYQFFFKDLDVAVTDSELMLNFINQYYLASNTDEGRQKFLIPEEVVVPRSINTGTDLWKEGVQLLQKALATSIEFHAPKKGKALETLEMLKKTAVHHLSSVEQVTARTYHDLIDLKERLRLAHFPKRIECFDISHFQGEGTVASRVTFIEGKPEKSLYRKYHVRGVTGPDDFKSLLEIVGRRFSGDEAQDIPDLVVIDGGIGQLNQAVAVFKELGLERIDLVSLAKARTERNFKSQEITTKMERVFKPGQKNPIPLKPGSGAYRVLTQIRDESHRFAITFHRKVRDRRVMEG